MGVTAVGQLSHLRGNEVSNPPELTFSPFGPGGPIGPGGPACPCGEQTACEEAGKSCGTDNLPWFPARSHKPWVVHVSFGGTRGQR